MGNRGAAARILSVVAAAAIVASAVSGCTLLARPATGSTPTPTASAEPVPLPQQLPHTLVAGQTLATGRLAAVPHDPIDSPRATDPLTGEVRVVVDSALRIEVRVRPDHPVDVDPDNPGLELTSDRYDGGPAAVQDSRHPLGHGIGEKLQTDPDGELVMPVMPGTRQDLGDLSYFHSLVATVPGDERAVAAAALTWTTASPFPDLHPADGGAIPFARGTTIVDGGALTGYVPNPYDTLFAVSQRFGIRVVELIYLNPWLGYIDPQLKSGIAINLDPARR
ncbi:hypothetical protein KNO15_04975 [Leifsonia shinshuensis]|uniref:hypothetical protein n=1 Tax=Leifsonia shinshuensis TaxID=150026 RepID=UPI001F511E14|nr:hypothetical protein [Leifsonia shinshuensis]MCI0156047.1 hypothetical protein [Leifsonia shinshuensis]